ncbi:hypothetical protein D9M71_141660 [compost metagenome]
MVQGELGKAAGGTGQVEVGDDLNIVGVQRNGREAIAEQRRQPFMHIRPEGSDPVQVVFVLLDAVAVLLQQFNVQPLIFKRGHAKPCGQ